MTIPTTTSSAAPSARQQDLPGLRDAMRLWKGLRGGLAHHEVVDGRTLPPLVAFLSAWQSLRLSRTYADLLEDPEFRPACQFFLSEIYAPRDFSQRDYNGARIYDFMNRFLPEAALQPLALALELNAKTQQLDWTLAEVMRTQLGVVDHFETWQYEEAYRLCDNYEDRLRQIELIVEIGHHLNRLRRLPFISTTLRLARSPAQRLGWVEMHDFLKRGFTAWSSLRRVDLFLSTIEQREKAILNRIYGRPAAAAEENPFWVTDGGAPEIVLPDEQASPSS